MFVSLAKRFFSEVQFSRAVNGARMNWRSRNRRKRQEIGLCVHCFTSPQIGEHLRHHPGFRKGMGPLIRTHGSGSELRSFLLVAHVVDVYGLLMMPATS